MQQLPLGVSVREAARFDSFVPGGNAELLARLTGPAPGPVLWLWGRAGTGKTHLLQAACASAGDLGERAAYVDPLSGAEPGWLEGCESLDLVALDSLDGVAGDASWNAALFRLHTLLGEGGGRLLVASTSPPASLRFVLPDLQSRLLAAPVYQLHELDDEDRVAALELRARRRGLELPHESALYLLHRLPRDMHTICGALDRLDAASLAAQRRLTVPFLRAVLEDQASSES